MSRKKYIRRADADRVKAAFKAAIASLVGEVVPALAGRITSGMKAAEIEAVIAAEIRQMLPAVDQIRAEMFARLDDAAIDGDDGAA